MYYFIDNEYYFIEMDYMDIMMMEKDLDFSRKTVLELIKEIDWQPDIINCNDWQTGILPVFHNLE